MRVYPDELREAAKHLRHLGGELDHIRWRVRTDWERLDRGWQSYSSGAAEAGYERVSKMLASMAEALHQCAWALEATASWIEEADRQAAAGFLSLGGRWGVAPIPMEGVESTEG